MAFAVNTIGGNGPSNNYHNALPKKCKIMLVLFLSCSIIAKGILLAVHYKQNEAHKFIRANRAGS